MNYPLLTICLLTHNSERFLEKALESILKQTYPNFEILVSDNGSTDQTIKIIKLFQKQNPKIIFRQNTAKIIPGKFYDGCYDNCNGCLRSDLIKGEFVAFYHSDDIYGKEIAKKEAEFLIKNPQVGAVFALARIINEKGKMIGKFKLPKELKKKNTYNFIEIFKALLNNGNIFLLTSSFMTRKKIFEQVGLFSEEFFGTSRDLDMWLRILKKYLIAIINENLMNWRIGGGGTVDHRLRTERADFFKVMDYYLKSKSLALKIEKKFLRQYEYQKRFNDTLRAMNYLIKNEKEKAKELINRHLSLSLFWAFFENINIRKTKGAILRIVLIAGINLNLGKYLGKILYKLRYTPLEIYLLCVITLPYNL